MGQNVAIGILEYDNNILFIKRQRNSFQGLWGLPGGKVEKYEHIDEAVVREFFEETGIKVEFGSLLGVTSEIINENDISSHVILYCCSIKINNEINIKQADLQFIPIEEINFRKDIIQSDVVMINNFYLDKNTNYLKITSSRNSNGYNTIVLK